MFQCGECSMVFTTAGSVRRHMAVHQVSQTYSFSSVLNLKMFHKIVNTLNGRPPGKSSQFLQDLKLIFFSHKYSEHFEWETKVKVTLFGTKTNSHKNSENLN